MIIHTSWMVSITNKRRASSNSPKASCNHYKNLLTHDKLPTKSMLQMTLSFAAMCVSQQLTRKNAGIQAKIQPRNMPNEIEHTRPLVRDLNEMLRLISLYKITKICYFRSVLPDEENDTRDNRKILDIQIHSNNGLFPLYIPYFPERGAYITVIWRLFTKM